MNTPVLGVCMFVTVSVSALSALAAEPPAESQVTTVCGEDSVRGIDVSKWQGQIDWSAVAQDGIDFAFVRVSDGRRSIDPKFEYNWRRAAEVGLYRGTYQFFRPGQDPIAQAEILLDAIGRSLGPMDLPPVIDVETADGFTPAEVSAAVIEWVQHVEAALGVAPIVYTIGGFWDHQVGSLDLAGYPLWIAHFGPMCPNIPDAWDDWTFFQNSATGRVDGVSGDVDTNYFNGTLAELANFASRAPCDAGEPIVDGVIDDGHPCFLAGGDPRFIREDETGFAGGLKWTHTTDLPATENYGQWTLPTDTTGLYALEVYMEEGFAESERALYEIAHTEGISEVIVDQSAQAGWVELGEFTLRQGGEHWVRVNDNTGEPGQQEKRLVFDALRVRMIDQMVPEGQTPEGDLSLMSGETGGCSSVGRIGGGSWWGLVIALVFARPRRRLLGSGC